MKVQRGCDRNSLNGKFLQFTKVFAENSQKLSQKNFCQQINNVTPKSRFLDPFPSLKFLYINFTLPSPLEYAGCTRDTLP